MDTQKRVIIAMNDSFDEEETRQYIKTYMFIKGVAVARNLRQTKNHDRDINAAKNILEEGLRQIA